MKIVSLSSVVLLACTAIAQGPDFAFTLTLPELTLSGSGSTSLSQIRPNEIAHYMIPPTGCGSVSAEKWAPRGMFHTQAGDEDGDDSYWEPGLFGQIDALSYSAWPMTPNSPWNRRTIFFSPRQPMGNAVSLGASLRPGDVGRIVRGAAGDGQVEYLITAEMVQIALGLPPTPAVVNVDAVSVTRQFGVVFSLEFDRPVALCTGATMVRDGDVLMIPGSAISWTSDGRVASVAPGSAVIAYDEGQMDLFVSSANVANRNGICLSTIGDTDALQVVFGAPTVGSVPTCFGPAPLPELFFSGSMLTGGAILTTAGGGMIRPGPCGPMGTTCGGFTSGMQIGLRPPSPTQGIASSVNGLCDNRTQLFTLESPTPQVAVGTAFSLDVNSPGPLTFILCSFAPSGPAGVATSANFPFGLNTYPDYYPTPFTLAGSPFVTPSMFASYTSPAVPFTVDLVLQAAAVAGGSIALSNPVTVEVF